MMLLHARSHCPLSCSNRRQLGRTGCKAGAGSSPWSSPSKGSGSSGRPNSKAGNSKTGGKAKGKSTRDGPKKLKGSQSGLGFGPKAQPRQQVQTYKITPPLSPQLLDELSGWEASPAPLWGTFTGHCEGTWLGQYSAYTPWGGDPEPVWADVSGSYLTHAFCRVTEQRQLLPSDDADQALPDSSSSSSLGDGEQQQQQGEQALDLLVRTTQRSASISSLIGGVSASAAAAAAAASAGEAAAEDDEQEAVAYNIDGSVVFNGGSYSLGPDLIDVPEADEDTLADFVDALEAQQAGAGGAAADAADTASAGSSADGSQEAQDPLSVLPFSTVVVEQALVAAGDRRLRLVATLKLRRPPGQELDIEVARLLLYREYWYGTAGSTGSSATAADSAGSSGSGVRLQLVPAHQFEVPVTELPRPQPSDLSGTWNAFVMAANPAVEENPDTLQDEAVVLYSSREERQHWHVPTITSSAARAGGSGSSSSSSTSSGSGGAQAAAVDMNGDSAAGQHDSGEGEDDSEDSGGSFWLPGGAVVTLRMVDNSSGGGEGARSSGRSHRGVLVGLHMLDAAGSCLFIEREYDAEGQLLEVRHGTAVKGGWSGGRM